MVYFVLPRPCELILDRFINHHNLPAAEQFFPGMDLVQLDTGHWGKLYMTLHDMIADCSCIEVQAERCALSLQRDIIFTNFSLGPMKPSKQS